ncbi:MAG TPA: PqqD family peptide modification chaperone [Acidimicrobiia bacterium]|nr:PqqD family peptide modification chaperone [Acidimicrobiia bacterium]
MTPAAPGDAATGGPRFAHSPAVLTRVTSTATLLLTDDLDVPARLDDVGAAVWSAFDPPCAVAEVAALLARRFDRPLAVVEREIAPLVADLVECAALVATD